MLEYNSINVRSLYLVVKAHLAGEMERWSLSFGEKTKVIHVEVETNTIKICLGFYFRDTINVNSQRTTDRIETKDGVLDFIKIKMVLIVEEFDRKRKSVCA